MSQKNNGSYKDHLLKNKKTKSIKKPLNLPVSKKNIPRYEEILKVVLPNIGARSAKIVLVQVMVALKLEGIVGKEMTSGDVKMIKVIKDSIMLDQDKKKNMVNYSRKLLEDKD